MKKTIIISTILVALTLSMLALPFTRHMDAEPKSDTPSTEVETVDTAEPISEAEPLPEARKIFLALLLDTSNSMDGLIDQAKSQLWNIVDEMADAEYRGQPAELYIGLYEYGNDNLSVRSGYVKQVSSFTQDLDEISTQLFALNTNGGSEYCGAVIHDAIKDLTWGENPDDLKMIFIAGNEPFDQGNVDFKFACNNAKEKNTIVNTIFCGNYQEGIDTFWKKGATLGGGSYMNIDMDKKTVYINTPYDPAIDSLNDALNTTYIGYGAQGAVRKQKQMAEDANASSYGQSNKVKRAISKSKHVYKNEQWDLVDAVKSKKVEVEKIETKDLPEEMKSMSVEERKTYVADKEQQRSEIQKQIKELAIKRRSYVKEAQKNTDEENELENAIVESVRLKAKEKSFKFKEE